MSTGTRQAPASEVDQTSPVVRAWWTVAGLTVVLWGFQLFGYVDIYPAISIAVVVLGAWGIGTIVAVWQPHTVPRWASRVLAGVTLGLSIAAFLGWSYLQVRNTPAYGTDEIAFDQYAAELFRHGLNPYTHSMAQAFTLFHVSPNGYTFLLNGHAVTSLSYPSLSFLAYVPFLLAGWTTQMAVAINVFAWAIAIVLTFVLLPRPLRPLAIVVGSFAVYISYAVGGVTDALFVPLLIGAVYQWDRFAHERSFALWRGPILLGLAMAVKQTPWLILPFLVAALVIESGRGPGGWKSGAGTGSRYLAIALTAFTVPNLPFIVGSPHAWLDRNPHSDRQPYRAGRPGSGGTDPLPRRRGWVPGRLYDRAGGRIRHLVVGLRSDLSGPQGVGGPLPLGRPLLLRPVIRELPGDPPAGRTGGGNFGPPSGAGRHRAGPDPTAGTVDRRARPGRLVSWPSGPSSPRAPPLAVRITSVRTTGQLATVVQVGVEVDNRTGHSQTPAFTVESGGQLTAFWPTIKGPTLLAPGRRPTTPWSLPTSSPSRPSPAASRWWRSPPLRPRSVPVRRTSRPPST